MFPFKNWSIKKRERGEGGKEREKKKERDRLRERERTRQLKPFIVIKVYVICS